MDLIRKRLEQLGKGCITGMWDLTVWRIGDSYIVGDEIRQQDPRLTIDEAVQRIWDLTR